MGRQWNPEGVPNDLLVPKGTFHFEIGEIAEDEINGKLVYKPDLTCVEPKAYKGKKLFGITYWIGTDDDKDGNDPETWAASRGAVDMKKLIVASGVKPTNDIDHDREAAQGRIVGITVGKRTRKTDDTRTDNTAADYWKAGTRALEIFDDEDKPKVKVVAPVAAVPAKVKPKPAPVEVEEEEEEEEEVPATPPPPVKSTAAELPKPGKPKKSDKKECPKCKQMFDRSVLLEHMAVCGDDDEEEEDD